MADRAAQVAKILGHDPRLKWDDAQKFELHHAIEYMKQQENFMEAIGRPKRPECYMSRGFGDEMFVREFFGGSETDYRQFAVHLAGKAALDVGPCLASLLSLWDVAASRSVIEPLYDAIINWQTTNLGMSGFANIDRAYSQGAEIFIPELVGKIDGAILVRNCIDHSPHWAFILSNIAAYAASGCTLLLWNDLTHPPMYLNGHYDITDDAATFRRLIEMLGFHVDYEFSTGNTEYLDYGCRATKI
ncbi:MAG: hypothetical protein P0Y65_16610 [Candidatus Devosia phytovorans]|uniref:Uncharacterized protein n=1 Tax=Candidatus Devosia phytovorans TaxID=3121372 RepID=A0AAJ5VTC2_9HYPH|nr:hypothetical protein [Devosia sp.]WEK03796.1 MAG: hypothetical protein P0Y65_16610 [Devosia sp.]